MKILTFDIEEWFHILDHESTKDESSWDKFDYRIEKNMDRIFQLLANNEQSATFFSLGWVAKKFPKIIKKIDGLGYEIGSHSNLHALAFDQTRDEFKVDLENSIKTIQDISGKKVKYYRAPGFSLNESNKWVFTELINQGIEIDCSIFPASRAHGGFQNFPSKSPVIVSVSGRNIKEFPINTISLLGKNLIFSGGGYFRLIPYPLIKFLTHRSDYIMTYFHPRDFDYDQPIINDLSKIRKFKSYYGLKNAFEKLEKLIKDFEFIDLHQANQEFNWKISDIVEI